jgi:uncharacterized membrane protein YeaQ/YmgE (transglycosylase-associated protein family)
MNFKMYIIGGLIYVILAIVLGFLFGMLQSLSFLAPFALLISALIAGIYVGRKAQTPTRGAIDGVITGIIGGIIAGIIAGFIPMPTSTGVSLLDMIALMLGATIGSYITFIAGFGFFIGAGIILGAIGGYIGRKLKK